jgi:nucleotide-binding universal stress UspA family protein
MTKEKMPGKVLIAVDGSPASFKAASYGLNLCKRLGAEPTSVYVILFPPEATQELIDGLKPELMKRAHGVLTKVSENAEAVGITVKGEILKTDSSIVRTIADYAENESFDLIVLGTKGTDGVPKMLLGSVAAGVVAVARCPVLVVR